MRKQQILMLAASLSLLVWQSVAAHTFYEGIVDISINPNNGHLEVVHQYTTHDLSTMLTERNQKTINPDSPEFETALRKYLESHFQLRKGQKTIKLKWVGAEAGLNVTRIYQELADEKQLSELSGLEVDCTTLIDFYPRQINRVNYQDEAVKGTLIFNDRSSPQTIRSPQ